MNSNFGWVRAQASFIGLDGVWAKFEHFTFIIESNLNAHYLIKVDSFIALNCVKYKFDAVGKNGKACVSFIERNHHG